MTQGARVLYDLAVRPAFSQLLDLGLEVGDSDRGRDKDRDFGSSRKKSD